MGPFERVILRSNIDIFAIKKGFMENTAKRFKVTASPKLIDGGMISDKVISKIAKPQALMKGERIA